jgi:uncharacterized protein
MQSKLLHEANGKRTFAVILQKGDEAMRCLQDFAVKERLGGAQVTAIGAFSSAKLAFFDWETKQYEAIPVGEQVEVASLNGDIAVGPDGKPSVHVHAVLGRRDGVLRGHHVAADCSRLYIRASRIKKPRYNGAPSQDLVVNPAPAKTSPTCCGGASSPFGSKTRKAAASPSTRGLRASPVPRCSKLPMPSGVALSPSTASSSGRPSRVPRPSSLMPSPRRHLGELEEPGHGQVAAHVLHHHHHRQRPRRPHPRPNASDHPRVTSGGSPTSSPIRATCDSLPFRANEKCGRSRRG